MNQHSNLIQWKNLTKEQQEGFDFTRPELYEVQTSLSIEWKPAEAEEGALLHCVYRLKIVDDVWYYCEWPNNHVQLLNGLGVSDFDRDIFITLRPAKPSEIPKPILQGEDLVGYLCGVSDDGTSHAEFNANNLENLTKIDRYEDGMYSSREKRWHYAYPVPADKIKQLKNLENLDV